MPALVVSLLEGSMKSALSGERRSVIGLIFDVMTGRPIAWASIMPTPKPSLLVAETKTSEREPQMYRQTPKGTGAKFLLLRQAS